MVTWTVPPTQLFNTALIDMLRTALEPGIRVYDSNVPTNAQFPYVVVTSLLGGEPGLGPPLTAPDADEQIVFQVDGVGARRDQAQYAADRARMVVLGRTSSGVFASPMTNPAGWSVCDRMRNDVPGGVEQEGAPPSVTYTVPNRYTLAVTPA